MAGTLREMRAQTRGNPGHAAERGVVAPRAPDRQGLSAAPDARQEAQNGLSLQFPEANPLTPGLQTFKPLFWGSVLP